MYATATTTDLFFRQAVGRFVRWQHGVRNQGAWLYVPDDPRVRAWAALITKQRRHSLARGMSRHSGVSDGRATSLADDDLDQLSLFAPLSAVATETVSMSPWHEALPDEWSAVDGPWVAAGVLDQADVEDELYAAAEHNHLVADDGARQTWATIRSGLSAGLQQPVDLNTDR